MSQEGVRRVVGRLISDPEFKKAFHDNPQGAIEKSGYAVAPNELQALSKIKAGDLAVNISKRPGPGGVESFDVGTFSSVRTA
jgi:hypothetical protein